MKKLTLNQAWVLCLRQWKWIIKELDESPIQCIAALKHKWCLEHRCLEIAALCFFCEYATQQNDEGCCNCPGKFVGKQFSCENMTYDYTNEPRRFYKKLLALNQKRKEQKQKTK
jgi:hypothetical protein